MLFTFFACAKNPSAAPQDKIHKESIADFDAAAAFC
jgi:hypothetical protein